ncbi:diaminopimelate epimerase [Pedobacter sp. CG_S7]
MLNTAHSSKTMIPFFKYQGAGNDFVIVDNRHQKHNTLSTKTIAMLCDRRFGIGADGFMLLQSHPGYDFEMRYFNADGKPGSMCGNGGRCIVAFAKYLGIIDAKTTFLAVDGPHFAKISPQGNQVDLQMIDVNLIQKDGNAYVLNTGSPHYVKQVTELETFDVYREGKAIRNNDTYKEKGINVNFIEDKGDYLFVRTFERGVEEETYACGTGVTAVALSMAQHTGKSGHLSTPIKVLGGDLRIAFDYDGYKFNNIFLCGPAVQVFSGEINI